MQNPVKNQMLDFVLVVNTLIQMLLLPAFLINVGTASTALKANFVCEAAVLLVYAVVLKARFVSAVPASKRLPKGDERLELKHAAASAR